MALGTKELDPQRPFNNSEKFKKTRVRIWHLKTSITGKKTNKQKKNPKQKLSDTVGPIIQWSGRKPHLSWPNTTTHTSSWWGSPSYTEPNPQPLASFPDLKTQWDDLTTEGHWPATERLYWICGTNAYSVLPASWSWSCVLGTIHLSFFLFPLAQGESLGRERPHQKAQVSTDWRLERWRMASWMHNPILQASHMGRRWVLGLLNHNLHA